MIDISRTYNLITRCIIMSTHPLYYEHYGVGDKLHAFKVRCMFWKAYGYLLNGDYDVTFNCTSGYCYTDYHCTGDLLEDWHKLLTRQQVGWIINIQCSEKQIQRD